MLHPKCNQEMTDERERAIGDVCHIKGKNPGSPRYDHKQSDDERHVINNLILLCPTHHRIIDTNLEKYDTDFLNKMKSDHERKIKTIKEASDILALDFLFKDSTERIKSIHNSILNSVENKATLIIHLVPLDIFERNDIISLDEIAKNREFLKPLRYYSLSERFHSNKFTVCHSAVVKEDFSSCVSMYKNGIIEVQDDFLLKQIDSNLIISNPFFERTILNSISEYLDLYKVLEINPPIEIIISLFGIENYRIEVNIQGKYFIGLNLRNHRIRQNIITLSEIIIDDYAMDLNIAFKQSFDDLWNASNFPGKPNYESDNLWSEYSYYKKTND